MIYAAFSEQGPLETVPGPTFAGTQPQNRQKLTFRFRFTIIRSPTKYMECLCAWPHSASFLLKERGRIEPIVTVAEDGGFVHWGRLGGHTYKTFTLLKPTKTY